MRTFNVVLVVAGLFVLNGCSGQTSNTQKLSVEAFDTKLQTLKNEILIDVRTADEFAEGHLPDAILIDYLADDFKSQISKLDKSKPVLLYCHSGARSAKAANIMRQAGFVDRKSTRLNSSH